MMRKLELSCPAGLEAFSRIKKLAFSKKLEPQDVAMRYALERFLARLFAEPAGMTLDGTATCEFSPETLTLKGGLTMFVAEGVEPLEGRSTSDADFHLVPCEGGGHMAKFVDHLRDVLARMPDGPDDGIRFDLDTLAVQREKDGVVPGGKVTVTCQIGKFALKIRADLAFDARPVHEAAVTQAFPSVLKGSGLPPFEIRRTPFAYTVADKVQAMVRQGAGNYRLRDYYDLYVIFSGPSEEIRADLALLPEALVRTFDLYGSRLPAAADEIPALSDAFAAEKAGRWEEERGTKHYGGRVPELHVVVAYLREALDPVLRGVAAEPRPF